MPLGAVGQFALFDVTIEAGVANRVFTTVAPFPCQVLSMYSAAGAADATDKFRAILRTAADVALLTGGDVVAADTVITNTADNVYIGKDQVVELLIDYSGTAANVKAAKVVVWAIGKR